MTDEALPLLMVSAEESMKPLTNTLLRRCTGPIQFALQRPDKKYFWPYLASFPAYSKYATSVVNFYLVITLLAECPDFKDTCFYYLGKIYSFS